jgi:hypothetical protein
MYVNCYDRKEKFEDENPTVGIKKIEYLCYKKQKKRTFAAIKHSNTFRHEENPLFILYFNGYNCL